MEHEETASTLSGKVRMGATAESKYRSRIWKTIRAAIAEFGRYGSNGTYCLPQVAEED